MSWLEAKDWATGVEYSSLFHSGLRAISRRPRARRTRAYLSSPSSQENGSSGETSSTVPPSSRLLRRSTTRSSYASPPTSISPGSSPTPLPYTSRATRRRPLPTFVRQTKELADTWSPGRSFFELGEHPKFPEEERHRAGYFVPSIEIDGIPSLAGPQSFFVNLGETDEATVSPVGEESFLFLPSDLDGFLHHPIPRRALPVSVQMMALPSRCSSVHHCTCETKRERNDCAWMEESSPEQEVYETGDEERSDVADWRQFHVDWLQAIR